MFRVVNELSLNLDTRNDLPRVICRVIIFDRTKQVPLFRQVNRRRWQQTGVLVTQTFAQGPTQYGCEPQTYPTVLPGLVGFVFAYRFRANAQTQKSFATSVITPLLIATINNYFHSCFSHLASMNAILNKNVFCIHKVILCFFIL